MKEKRVETSEAAGGGLPSCKKQNLGITLIALIITIIVMLILVAVSTMLITNSRNIWASKICGRRAKRDSGTRKNTYMGSRGVDSFFCKWNWNRN